MSNRECIACSKELVYVFDGKFEQYSNALWIEFSGGYGEFVDVLDYPNPYSACICHECAHELCDKIPWIDKLINPHGSHVHTEEYRKSNPSHYGWDYDWAKEQDGDM